MSENEPPREETDEYCSECEEPLDLDTVRWPIYLTVGDMWAPLPTEVTEHAFCSYYCLTVWAVGVLAEHATRGAR